jgi:hypothetical protein
MSPSAGGGRFLSPHQRLRTRIFEQAFQAAFDPDAHCPRCQGAAARSWLEAREADPLPVGYFQVVFTLPAEVAAIAYYNARPKSDGPTFRVRFRDP